MAAPVIVGIAGGSGSGKSTIAHGLATLTERFGSVVICQDDYYKGIGPGVDVEAYNFDEPAALDLDLLAHHLSELKRGHSVAAPLYDFHAHGRREETRSIAPCPLVFVEGLFLFAADPLRSAFDIRFFIDVPAEERLRRRIGRDTSDRGRTPEDIRRQFESQVEPMYRLHIAPTRIHAHFVLDMPHPDDQAYCEQVVEMWRRIEVRFGTAATSTPTESVPEARQSRGAVATSRTV
jgi:uridine kinase